MKELQHYAVPAGTKPSECRGTTCRAVIFWIKSPAGRNMPVDCDHCEECRHPQDSAPLFGDAESRDGLGVSHFQTCPDVGQFSHAGARR